MKSNSSSKDLLQLDIYELFDIEINASEKEIKSAYRKKALKCHPDKNPDDSKAAEKFLLLSDCYELLLDSSARAAYDVVLKGRKASALRTSELDFKRRKLKSDLDERERLAEYNDDISSHEKTLEREIARIRAKGNKLLEEEQKMMRESLKHSKLLIDRTINSNKLKIKWKEIKSSVDSQSYAYNEASISKIFSKYGVVNDVVLMRKGKKCSGIIEMRESHEAKLASNLETGLSDTPLIVTLVPLDGSESSTSYPNGDLKTKTQSTRTDTSISVSFEEQVLKKLMEAGKKK